MTESDRARLHTTIEGHVQGVGFRMFVLQVASELGLTGWVRNRWNGDVEVTAEGERTALSSLLTALHRGPRASYVTKVTPDWEPATGEFADFRMRSTG